MRVKSSFSPSRQRGSGLILFLHCKSYRIQSFEWYQTARVCQFFRGVVKLLVLLLKHKMQTTNPDLSRRSGCPEISLQFQTLLSEQVFAGIFRLRSPGIPNPRSATCRLQESLRQNRKSHSVHSLPERESRTGRQ